ncbi:MAG: 4Fe-4S binding protein [Desulfobacula sp.]|jgi:ferredoxin/flavodoxin|uniref:EFR1 family ferrodoxin n=1 Tax=Desulfobacula sp. TaxID=2593537 RepID=UPI001DB2452A|nr:4Fe-4S binding protein [Desulfobacula sp.]MBT3486785.1 4Fe-4S binding protein [Desulfobacula sp.]MBT3806458.1 4Fe-4S binding protein [Desulfobacula sp.]MBT4026433.1 4Fe-4S binding protein [Desulfobacula sp.]MBT4201062.1 4Fe-4S binding protein [Desulfobacula sp.]
MDIKSVSCIYFSPTGTTGTIIKNIAKGMQSEQIEMMDCTSRSIREKDSFVFKNDLVILATPVYYGRVPEEVVPFLKTLSVQNTPVVLAVVYGNREYEDALIELHDISVEQGFIPVAAGAFIAEHSYSNSSRPIAHARPDVDDIEAAQAFGSQIREKLKPIDSLEELEKISVPGNIPYIEPENLNMIKQVRNTLSFTPATDKDKCTQCNLCAEVCPTQAIDSEDISQIDKWQCIICFACIKNCPTEAKQMTDPHFNGAIEQLQIACQKRKEPEIYL